MATILSFPTPTPIPTRKISPDCSLTRPECDAVRAMADDLMDSGFASTVRIHNDGQYICLHDQSGAPYYIGREDGVYSAFDPNETMISMSTRFAHVLDSLEFAMMGIVPVNVPMPAASIRLVQ